MEREMEIGETKIATLQTNKVLSVGYKFKDQKEWYWEILEHIEGYKYNCKLIGKIMLVEAEM